MSTVADVISAADTKRIRRAVFEAERAAQREEREAQEARRAARESQRQWEHSARKRAADEAERQSLIASIEELGWTVTFISDRWCRAERHNGFKSTYDKLERAWIRADHCYRRVGANTLKELLAYVRQDRSGRRERNREATAEPKAETVGARPT